MSTLILEIEGNRMLNRVLFAPKLIIYDDILVYKTRGIIRVNEITLSYNHIAQVNLKRGLFFASLEIVNNGAENVLMRYILKDQAIKAKKSIDQKIYHAHAKEKLFDNQPSVDMHNLEKSLNRYKELMSMGKISKKEFEKKRQELLKKI